MTTNRSAALLVLAAILGGCDLTGPKPGTLLLTVDVPQVDGGLLLTINGPHAANVRAAGSHLVLTRQVTPSQQKVLILGEIRDGALLEMDVSDTDAWKEYVITVDEAAAPGSTLRSDVSAYIFTWSVR